jgi:hypothetical protein
MTKPMRPRIPRLFRVLAGLAVLAAAGLAAGSGPARAASDPRVAGATAPRVGATRTNTEMLVAARAVARSLADQVPLTPGTRVALQPEGSNPVDTDLTEALLLALNRKGFTCELVPAPPPDSLTGAASTAPDTAGMGASAAAVATGLGARDAYLRLQAERKAQAARADSLAALAGPAAASAPRGLPAAAVGLPLLSYRVAEGRVDYVRSFRSGIFGAERLERRATARVTLKLRAPGDDAVRWSASADTSFGDVVAKADIGALEDRLRPETRPIAPQSNLKKIVEPALVVALIAGLVALFYQNRP